MAKKQSVKQEVAGVGPGDIPIVTMERSRTSVAQCATVGWWSQDGKDINRCGTR